MQTPVLIQPSDPQPSESVTLGNSQVWRVFMIWYNQTYLFVCGILSCADVRRTWGSAVLDFVWKEPILLTQRNRPVTVLDASLSLETQRDQRNEICCICWMNNPKYEYRLVSVGNLFLICLCNYILVYYSRLSLLKMLHDCTFFKWNIQ